MFLNLIFLFGGFQPPLINGGRDIYLILPDTGELSLVSREFLRGFELALGDSIPFYRVNETQEKPFDSIYLDIISRNPFLVVGPILPANARIAADLSMRNRVLDILPVAYDVYLGTYGNYVYPFNYKTYASIIKFLDYSTRMGDTSFVLMYEKTLNGLSIKKFFDAYYPVPTILLKSSVVKKEEVKEILKDIRGFRAIFFSDGGLPSVNMYLNLRKMGFRGNVYALDSWLDRRIISLLIGFTDRLYIFGLYGPRYSSYLVRLDKKYAFVENYRQKYDEPPTEMAFIGYDAGSLVRDVYVHAQSVDSAKSYLLHYGVLYGVSGEYLISKKSNYIGIYRITPGGIEKVEPGDEH